YVMDSTGDSSPVVGFQFGVQICDVATTMAKPECETTRRISLSPDYYKGDRSMRESGFDISFRFGPYGSATHHYAPVCLNSLLYKTERDIEQISVLIGKNSEGKSWETGAATRQKLMTQYLWDAEHGFFFDYEFTTGKKSSYRYLTTYYPLWAGLATPEQAAAVAKNLPPFEYPGGLAMSPENTGMQ